MTGVTRRRDGFRNSSDERSKGAAAVCRSWRQMAGREVRTISAVVNFRRWVSPRRVKECGDFQLCRLACKSSCGPQVLAPFRNWCSSRGMLALQRRVPVDPAERSRLPRLQKKSVGCPSWWKPPHLCGGRGASGLREEFDFNRALQRRDREIPGLKPVLRTRTFPLDLKSSAPLLKQGASTKTLPQRFQQPLQPAAPL